MEWNKDCFKFVMVDCDRCNVKEIGGCDGYGECYVLYDKGVLVRRVEVDDIWNCILEYVKL